MSRNIGRNQRAVWQSFGALVGSVGRGQAGGEGEGFEAGSGGVAWPIFQRGAHAQRPEFVEAAVQDAEGGVVGTGDGDNSTVWQNRLVKPCKHPVFRNSRGQDLAGDFLQLDFQCGAWVTVRPPVQAMPVAPRSARVGLTLIAHMRKGRFE